MTEQAGFPLPSQITDVPGAENWRSMYQYFTRFQADDDKRFWFYNSMHFPEPMPAFDRIIGEVHNQAIGANTARLYNFDKRADLAQPDRFAEIKADYLKNGPGRSNLRYGWVLNSG